MVRINLDLDGVADVEESLDDLKDRWTTDRVYLTGTNVEHAIILETGRGPVTADEGYLKFEGQDGETIFRKSVDGHPPYPWFKPAIAEFKADPEGFISTKTDNDSIDAITSADELVKTVAVGLQAQMQANASAQSAALDRSPGTHPEHPQIDSGTLVAKISADRIR